MSKVLPQELQVARTLLGKSHDYFASILWNLEFIEKPEVLTTAIDQYWRVYYNPDFVKSLSKEEMQGVLVHEMGHPLRNYFQRAEFFEDKMLFNIAHDMEMNPGIIDSGLALPKDCAMPQQIGAPNGLLAEEYYHLLQQHQQKQAGKNGKGSGHDHGPKGCGSHAGNGFEDPAPAAGDTMSNAERELLLRDVAKQIEQAVQQGRGNVPGDLQRWASNFLHPKVRWTKELAAQTRRCMIEVAGKMNYSYRKPSRRTGSGQGAVIKPSMVAYVPRIAMIFDTSGSMGEEDLNKSIAEAKGIIETVSGGDKGVTYFSVDAAVASSGKATKARAIKLGGGGGTDMRVGLKAAAEQRPGFDIVVVMTDGDTPWPKARMPFKVIVVLTREGAADQVPEDYRCITVN
jgi:predicted metal-dependent peptidase